MKIKTKKDLALLGKSVREDWIILVSFLFLTLLVALIYSSMTYFSIKNESFLSEEEVIQKSSLKVNTEQLDRVIKNLEDKKQKFDNF